MYRRFVICRNMPNFIRYKVMGDTQIIKGSLAPVIMKLLGEQGRMYGYEITKTVREHTEGRLNLTEAALYPALHKLVAEGLLKTETERVEGRIRKYYSLSDKGRREKTRQLNALQDSLSSLNLLLMPRLSNG